MSFANGEHMEFTAPQDYLRTIREELPTKDGTGFLFETLTDAPAVRKAVDDMSMTCMGRRTPGRWRITCLARAGDGRAADVTTQNRQPVLRCVLSNAAHPEYGQVTIPFPIPVMEYECTLECLAAMELGARLKRDCRVDELESGFPILKRLEGVRANLDEMDYLARRLDSFDKYEAAQFQAMAVRLVRLI